MATKEVTLTFSTQRGAEYPVSFTVSDGKSTYETWKELGNEGTEKDFIDSLSGSTTLVATQSNPINALTLPAGDYLLSETDDYTLSGVPSFYPRTAVVNFKKTDQGINLAMVEGKYYINYQKSGSGYYEFSTAASNPTYRPGNISGVYWGTSNSIYQKTNDSLVFGTEENKVSYFGYSFACPWITSSIDGVNMMWSSDGRVKFFLGGDSGSTPTKKRLHILPAISQETFESELCEIADASPSDSSEVLAEKINKILAVLRNANLIREAP